MINSLEIVISLTLLALPVAAFVWVVAGFAAAGAPPYPERSNWPRAIRRSLLVVLPVALTVVREVAAPIRDRYSEPLVGTQLQCVTVAVLDIAMLVMPPVIGIRSRLFEEPRGLRYFARASLCLGVLSVAGGWLLRLVGPVFAQL